MNQDEDGYMNEPRLDLNGRDLENMKVIKKKKKTSKN